jgi:hypothetical protein
MHDGGLSATFTGGFEESPEFATRMQQRLASEGRREAKSRKDASSAETKKRLATQHVRHTNNRDAETDAETKKRLATQQLRQSDNRDAETHAETKERQANEQQRQAENRDAEAPSLALIRPLANNIRQSSDHSSLIAAFILILTSRIIFSDAVRQHGYRRTPLQSLLEYPAS